LQIALNKSYNMYEKTGLHTELENR
jgi:hypothetical protein